MPRQKEAEDARHQQRQHHAPSHGQQNAALGKKAVQRLHFHHEVILLALVLQGRGRGPLHAQMKIRLARAHTVGQHGAHVAWQLPAQQVGPVGVEQARIHARRRVDSA